MPFDLSTAIAVREREDGLLEKDTFDFSTARSIEDITGGTILRAAKPGEIPYRPPPIKARANVEMMYKEAGEEVPAGLKLDWELTSPQKQALTGAVLSTALTGGLYPVVQATKGAAAEGGEGSIMDKVFKGIAYPDVTPALYRRLPGTKDLPPAAEIVAEVAESIIEYGILGLAKAALKRELLARSLARRLDAAAELGIKEKMAGRLPAGPVAEETFKNELKEKWKATAIEKLSAIEAELSASEIAIGEGTQGGGPSALESYARKRSLLGLIIEDLKHMNTAGQLRLPKIGQTVGFKDAQGIIQQGIIKEIIGERVTIDIMGRQIVATLPQLILPKLPVKPTPTGEQPPVEPPKTVVSGEPSSEEELSKLHKDYVRATPIGKILSQKEEVKQEIATQDFLIRTYEGDIAKLEEQLKVEQFNTEAEKAKVQYKLQALKDKYALAKETQRQRKTYRDEVSGLIKDIESAPKSNIAIEYQDMIEQLKSKFDLKRRTEKTMVKRESMKTFVERMKIEGRAIDIPAEKLAILDKVNLEEMTLDQLKEISSTIKQLETLGKTKLKAREAVYEVNKEKAKTELIETATPIKSKELVKLPVGEKHSTWTKKAIEIQNAAQKTGVGLTPIDGLADVTGMSKMKDVLDKDFSVYLTYNDKATEEWYKLTKDFTDKEFERIGVMAASRQEGGLERLANSGIVETEVKAIKLNPAEEKAYKFVLDTFNKEYPAVKQYSKEVYNADVGKQENYVSFMSDYELMSDLEIYQKFGQTPEQIATRKTKTVEQGFTKERAAVSKIKLETNIDKIFRRHMDDVAYMLTTGKNIKMYYEIVNSPEMREKLGDVGTLAWLQWLDLMARKGGAEGAKRIAVLDVLRRNIGAGVLSFRLSSALVQFSSFADTIATIGAEWATKGAVAISNKEWRDFIMDNFPEIKKAVGDDIAFREFGENALAKLANTGLKPLQFLDGLMRSTAAAGSYQKLAAEKGIAVDLKNPNPELITEATKLMRNSQGSSFFKDQPLAITAGYGLTDNRSVNKLLLTFQSFMLNRWDNINRQIWRMGVKEKNYKKAISSFFWLVIFAGAVEEGIRRGTRKITGALAKDKRKEDSFVQGTLLNIIQSVPLLGQLVSAITYSSNPVPVINTFDDLLEGIGGAIKGKAIETKAKGAVKTLGAIGSLSGLAGSSQVTQIIKDWIPSRKSRRRSL